jgi:hypothetical protein
MGLAFSAVVRTTVSIPPLHDHLAWPFRQLNKSFLREERNFYRLLPYRLVTIEAMDDSHGIFHWAASILEIFQAVDILFPPV